MSLEFPAKPPIFLISIDLLDFPLHFLYKYKGNQANRGKSRKSAVSQKIPNSNRPISTNFLWISKFLIFLNRKLSPLERRMPELLFFIWKSSAIMVQWNSRSVGNRLWTLSERLEVSSLKRAFNFYYQIQRQNHGFGDQNFENFDFHQSTQGHLGGIAGQYQRFAMSPASSPSSRRAYAA